MNNFCHYFVEINKSRIYSADFDWEEQERCHALPWLFSRLETIFHYAIASEKSWWAIFQHWTQENFAKTRTNRDIKSRCHKYRKQQITSSMQNLSESLPNLKTLSRSHKSCAHEGSPRMRALWQKVFVERKSQETQIDPHQDVEGWIRSK